MDIGAPAIDRLRHTKKGVGLSLSLSADSGAAFKVYEDATDKFSLMVPQGKSSGQLGFSFSFFFVPLSKQSVKRQFNNPVDHFRAQTSFHYCLVDLDWKNLKSKKMIDLYLYLYS